MGKIIVKNTVKKLPDHVTDLRLTLEDRDCAILSVTRGEETHELMLSMAEYQGLKDIMNAAANTIENLNWTFPEADMHIGILGNP